MKTRTDGIRRTKFREIILTDMRKGYVRGIFWSHEPHKARYFAKLMRGLGFAARIRRMKADKYHTVDQKINYILLNWRCV